MGLSIGDACAATGLSADTLRFYERIGLLDRVPRDDIESVRPGRLTVAEGALGEWQVGTVTVTLEPSGLQFTDDARDDLVVWESPAERAFVVLDRRQQGEHVVLGRVAFLADDLLAVGEQLARERLALARRNRVRCGCGWSCTRRSWVSFRRWDENCRISYRHIDTVTTYR